MWLAAIEAAYINTHIYLNESLFDVGQEEMHLNQ